MAVEARPPRPRAQVRDVLAMALLAAGSALLSAGGWTVSVTAGLIVTGAACVVVALLLGLSG